MELTSYYNITLVFISILIAVIASYASLNIVSRLRRSSGMVRYIWLTAGAFSLGFGIWSMHFIAMLAHHLSIPVMYDTFLVVLSIVLAVVACAIAFAIVSIGLNRGLFIFIGAAFISAGIALMHYVGMEAMVMDAAIIYDPLLFVLSIIIAFVASLAALYLFFYFEKNANQKYTHLKKIASSLVMGAAISGMHFTGMAAATYESMGIDHNHAHAHSSAAINTTVMGFSIGIGMFLLLTIILASTFLDRRFQQKTDQLQFLDNMYQSIIMTANDAIVLADSNGNIIAWNNAAEAIFYYKENEIIGKNLDVIIPVNYRKAHNKGLKDFIASGKEQIIGKSVELEGLRKNGEVFSIELTLSTLTNDENTYFSGIIRDISERKKNEKKITELVYRDPLTNLPNRRFLNNYLSLSIEQAAINHQSLAVLFIDLDRFKYINDTLGHSVGDHLLVEVSKRMSKYIEKKDMLARQGGDEYILIFPQMNHQHAAKISQQILDELLMPFHFEDNELFISASIGISMYPEDGGEADLLVKNADTAMYRAKDNGKNNYQFFTSDMNDLMAKKMRLEIGLRKAVINNELELYYQPQIHVNTGHIKGVEALIRWNHPKMGTVSPAEFIPLAEETGLIIQIGNWVIETACRQAKEWEIQGYAPVRMSINISARQFQQTSFVDTVMEIIENTKIDPQYLELELTETIVQDPVYAIPVLNQLKEMGIKLSLDDFGTGYSSLSYLKSFPLDTLKIDRSFISTVNESGKDAAIVKTIINMANSLDLNVIAEGVETNEQLLSLKQDGCDEYQGYLFSKPVKALEVQELLQKCMEEKSLEQIAEV
ncbi:bifunctional diguanylate cyclase/phosphodiesterase [Bacillus mesophilum]|uniref:EAL domain-containing protein n=1 Tax=Bacillus mesophilum TaxID=1071718 RepID=A0A7V7RMG3_9BACI|nr:bifunctional diguanylate cyclase/phosphodiesterase [Bacillus mesophilum]KAB2333500.1 EAL domain-containing protein [Bacillus mesophilum]